MNRQPRQDIDLSLVIPVYNERDKVERDLRGAVDFFRRHEFNGEIIVADDGSRDGTADVAELFKASCPVPLHVLRLEPHRGKGHAVRQGMIHTQGRLILFMDSGDCIPYAEILRGLQLIKEGACDIAHASRQLSQSVIVRRRPPSRRLSGWLFRHFFARLLGLPITLTDTQAGLKVYRGEIGRVLYAACFSDGFLFDAEVILRARRASYRICEFPVTWTSDPDSRLRLRWMPFLLIRDALVLKWRLRREWKNEFDRRNI